MADLLEIKGSNPFRIRAYRNAIQTINGLTQSLEGMIEDGEDLTDLPAVGKDIAGHIEELISTGGLSRLEEVAAQVPRTLAELVKLDGVGPKKVKKLWSELGVTTVDQLEEALEADRVVSLEGFGAKSAEKIRRSIEDYRKQVGRFLLSEAEVLIQPLLDYLGEIDGLDELEVAGSFRRRRETVGDLDLLACAVARSDIRITSDGTPWRPLIHCRDIAAAFVAFMEAPESAVGNRAVNVGANAENHQVRDVAEIVRRIVPKADLVFTGETGHDPRDYRVNFDLLSRLLPDFRLDYTLERGMEELYRKMVDHDFGRDDFEGDRFVRLRTLKKRLHL
ncbi:MAG: NAD-dependent epimerase/dehydratase family protein, partial [Planctomycetes bacterium]|nr:NAD-dependent epimerase/dehydratase family protein [Planctomycetota bacterium]